MELSKERSTEEAGKIKSIQMLLMTLDIDYLKSAYEEMKSNLNRQEAAMVLDPDPFTAIERQDLKKTKLRQLELYLEAAENLEKIRTVEGKLRSSQEKMNQIADFFL